MKNDELFELFSEVDDELLKGRDKRLHSGIVKRITAAIGALAACIILCIFIYNDTSERMRWNKDACASAPGIITENGYYFEVIRHGVYRYTPEGGTERVVHEYFVERWTVDDEAFYYAQGNDVYILPHGAEKSKKIFSSPFLKTNFISLASNGDGTFDVSVYYKDAEKNGRERFTLDFEGKILSSQQIISDGAGSEIIKWEAPAEQSYKVGEREIKWVRVSDDDPHGYLYENGEQLLADGKAVWYGGEYYGEYLIFTEESIYKNKDNAWVIISPDGRQARISFPLYTHLRQSNYHDGYVYYSVYGETEMEIWVLGLKELETWKLIPEEISDERGYMSIYELYDFVTDGEYLYSYVPWGTTQICWRVVRDVSGRPTELKLVGKMRPE